MSTPEQQPVLTPVPSGRRRTAIARRGCSRAGCENDGTDRFRKATRGRRQHDTLHTLSDGLILRARVTHNNCPRSLAFGPTLFPEVEYPIANVATASWQVFGLTGLLAITRIVSAYWPSLPTSHRQC